MNEHEHEIYNLIRNTFHSQSGFFLNKQESYEEMLKVKELLNTREYMKKQYAPTEEMRHNPLSKKPSNNVVKVVFDSYETLYNNVHHTNAFCKKIMENNDSWKEIWVNDLRIHWRKEEV